MSFQKVKEYLKQYIDEDRIKEFNESSATVELAAKALNCEEKEIAKSLSFKVNETAILIVMAGDSKVDNSKFKQTFHSKAKMLTYEETESLIGYTVGGVCPFLVKDGVQVYLDESLKRFEYIYPACGSCNSAVKITISELEQFSKFNSWVDVYKIIEK
jgi:prolyl-tRNA editing enzyme YbaK/EbsC (Cys-tRNA(Pro) deacylase)